MSLVKEGRLIPLLLLVFSVILFYLYTRLVRQGREVTVRTLPAVEAIREAVGRCAEMGRPLLYTTGITSSISSGRSAADSLAGISILGHTVRLCARMGVPFKYFTATIDAYPLIEETVKNAYRQEGKIEEYDEDSIELIANQSSLVSRYLGYLQRERPASACLIGGLAYESVVLSEGGNTIGALQISGTVNYYQTPFLVASTDYTLIMEELYAASAEISGDPDSLGALAGEDILKIVVLALFLIGTVFGLMRNDFLIKLLGM